MNTVLTFDKIQQIADGEWITEPGDLDIPLRSGAFDTRSINGAQIFFAWHGESSDGHRFIDQLAGTSIRLIIVEQDVPPVQNTAILKVANSLEVLHQLARFLASEFKGRIVSITGSCGKTTAKAWLRHMLSKRFSVLSNIESFNNHIGCPITILNLDHDHEIIILEMGTSGTGELELLSSIAPADVSVILNVGHAHLGKFGHRDAIYQAKTEIFSHHREQAKLLIPFQDSKIKKFMPQGVYDFFGKGAPLYSWELDFVDLYNLRQKLKFQTPEGSKTAWVNQLGHHAGETLSALIAICFHLGLNWNEIELRLCDLPHEKGRSTLISGINQVKILDDVYNANPESLVNMLKTLCSLNAEKYVAIIGNLAELDQNLAESVGVIVDQIPSVLTHLILTGETGKPIKNLIRKSRPELSITYLESIEEVIKETIRYCDLKTVIGVKGSRSAHMERVVYALSGEKISCGVTVCGLLKICNQCDRL